MDNRKYEVVKLFDKYALFSSTRIKKEDVPKGMYKYDLRADDIGWEVIEVNRSIMVHHFGTIITNTPILKKNQHYLDVDEEKGEFGFEPNSLTVKEYLQKHKSQEKLNKPIEKER